MNLNTFIHIAGSFWILDKAWPDEVNTKGNYLVLTCYPLAATLMEGWKGQDHGAAWAVGMTKSQPPTDVTSGTSGNFMGTLLIYIVHLGLVK